MTSNNCIVPAVRIPIAVPGSVKSVLNQVALYRTRKDKARALRFNVPTQLLRLVNPLQNYDEYALAQARIEKARQGLEKIVLFGDYDCDGIVSTVLMYELLKTAGVLKENLAWFIPNRLKHGYGLKKPTVEECCKTHRPSLLIALDCGSVNDDSALFLAEMKIDLVVIDHHICANRLKPVTAQINPHPCPVRHPDAPLLCAGALVYFVCKLLAEKWALTKWDRDRALILAGLATCADVMKLIGLNRDILKLSLNLAISNVNVWPPKVLAKVPQLAVLLGIAKPRGMKYINEETYSFVLGPCLNACGRMEDAKTSVKLLLAESPVAMKYYAVKCHDLNEQRKCIEAQNTEEAIQEAKTEFEKGRKVILVRNPNWHAGVVGIVASRVRDRYYRPAIVCTRPKDIWCGSGRSIDGYHMGNAFIKAVDEHAIESGGGHPNAGGLSFKDEQIDIMAGWFIAHSDIDEKRLIPHDEVIGQAAEHTAEEWHDIMRQLAPFGEGNGRPSIYADHAELIGKPSVITCRADDEYYGTKEMLEWLIEHAELGNILKSIIQSYLKTSEANDMEHNMPFANDDKSTKTKNSQSGVLWFTGSTFKNMPSLARKLTHPSDSVSKYLQNIISSETKHELSQYHSTRLEEQAVRYILAKNLNEVISRTGFYNYEAFKHVTTRKQTNRLIQEANELGGYARLNRMLLEDAYPDNIFKGEKYRIDIIGLRGSFKLCAGQEFKEMYFVTRNWWQYRDMWVLNIPCGLELRPWKYNTVKGVNKYEMQIQRWWLHQNAQPN